MASLRSSFVANHTHTGYPVRSPRRSGGRRFDHLNAAGGSAGRVHALNPEGAAFRALCGAVVEARYGNPDDLDGPITSHIRPAGEQAITCQRCRKLAEDSVR